jgi:hypothetical protein
VTNGFRTCKVCNEKKPKERFQPQGYQCRECRTEKQRAYYASLPPDTAEERKKKNEYLATWRAKNAERLKESSRVKHLKRKFNLTLEEYNSMSDSQNGLCAICQQKCETEMNLAVDHCHTTGKIRGLLCKNCNTAIGLFKEDTDNMLRAIEYIKFHKLSEAVIS